MNFDERLADASYAAGANDERERIRQLALSEAAKLRAGDSPEWMAPCAGALEDFADLLGTATPAIPKRQGET